MLPIPGPSRVEHLEQNIAAARLELDDADLRELGEAVGQARSDAGTR